MASDNNTRTIAPLFTWRSAIAESGLKPVVRHVLLSLSTYMNERGGSAYPGSTRLAHDTGLHVTTVKDSLNTAVREGYLVVIKKGGAPAGGKRMATEYAAASPVDNLRDWGSTDRGHTTTGSPGRVDRGSSPRGLVVHGDPITSLNSSENSGGCAPKNCIRCHGHGSFWDGMKDHSCVEHVFNDAPSAPAPWRAEGLTYAEWSERAKAGLGVGEA